MRCAGAALVPGLCVSRCGKIGTKSVEILLCVVQSEWRFVEILAVEIR